MNVQSVSGSSAAAASKPELNKLKTACRKFEAIFLDYMMKSMRKTVSKDTLFGSSDQEEQLFQGMMDNAVCNKIAQTRSLGLADMLYKQLSADLTKPNATAETQPRGESK